jgi:hypothetical protein
MSANRTRFLARWLRWLPILFIYLATSGLVPAVTGIIVDYVLPAISSAAAAATPRSCTIPCSIRCSVLGTLGTNGHPGSEDISGFACRGTDCGEPQRQDRLATCINFYNDCGEKGKSEQTVTSGWAL